MLIANQNRANGLPRLLEDLSGAALVLLVSIGNVFRRIQYEWRGNLAIRELNQLSDHHLNDIGIKRSDIDPIVDQLLKRVREGRYIPE